MESAYDANINVILNTTSTPSHLLPATIQSIEHDSYCYLRNEASMFETQIRGYMNPKRIDHYHRKLEKSKPKVCTCIIKDLNTVKNPRQDTDAGEVIDSETDSDETVIVNEGCISLRSHSEVYNQLRYGQIKYEQGEPRKYGQLWTEIWLEKHWSKQWYKCPNDVTRVEVESGHSNKRQRRKKAKGKKSNNNKKPYWANKNWFTKWYKKENRHRIEDFSNFV